MQSPPGPSREDIWKMFDSISGTYDRVNRMITLGLDQLWRKRMGDFLPSGACLKVLDCATGTGDQLLAFLKHCPHIETLVGIDLAEEMLKIAQEKLKPYLDKVQLLTASALEIPFKEQTFDCVSISFGIRNLTDTMAALQEFRRVLKPGGRVLILEGTLPANPWLAKAHHFHMNYLLPRLGGAISKQRGAYQYLNETIKTFPQGEKFNGKLRAAGFSKVMAHPLFGGVATIYQGDKE